MSEIYSIDNLPVDEDGFEKCFFSVGTEKKKLRFECDHGGQKPIYLFCNEDKIYFSLNLTAILDYLKKNNLLEFDEKATSFYLQNYVVPLPYSCYKDLNIISAGQVIEVKWEKNKWKISRGMDFKFENRLNKENSKACSKKIQDVLSIAVNDSLSKATDKALFLSGGKDSIPLAIAAVDAGHNDIICTTFRSPGVADESDIARFVANKLGVKHNVINFDFSKIDVNHLITYFENSPVPTMDYAALTYVVAGTNLFPAGTCVLDGSGSDAYIGHLPSSNIIKQKRRQIPTLISKMLRKIYPSDHFPSGIMRHEYELDGLLGTYWPHEQMKFDPNTFDTNIIWNNLVGKLKYSDPIDRRAFIRGQYLDHEHFLRKVRNASDAFNWDIKFPWTQQSVIDYFFNLPQKEKFDRFGYRNKVILREYIKNRVNVDSDFVGKKGFVFDYVGFLKNNISLVINEIISCSLWLPHVRVHVEGMVATGINYRKNSERLYCLFMISAWYNHSKYINK